VRDRRFLLPCNPAGALYAPGTPKTRARLKLISAKKNQITDSDAWLEQHSDRLPRRKAPRGISETYKGAKLVSANMICDPAAVIYGTVSESAGTIVTLYDSEEAGLIERCAFDFSKWAHGGKSLWVYVAHADSEALYVVASYPGYAQEVGGKTGYLAALDVKTGKLLWQAGPRVANGFSLLVDNEFLVCGYGFTREPDFLFVIDKKTGRTVQKIAVKSAPEHLAWEGNELFVRCYDTDYVFQIL
jgi:outer membrane protein assembly factor BamB